MGCVNDNTVEAKAIASLEENSDDVLQSLGMGNSTTTSEFIE